MSTALDYLLTWANAADKGQPVAVTFCQCQHSRSPAGGALDLGIAAYGWGTEAEVIREGGVPVGLRWDPVHVWFSDRRSPDDAGVWGQQFPKNASDLVSVNVVTDGVDVVLGMVLKTWGGQYTSTNGRLDESTQQLLFTVPGAGNGAPEALMMLSFGPGGVVPGP